MNHVYIAIDMKSFYASVECVYRGLDPLKADLLVADESRSDHTICLAVSPALKAKGVPSRPRLFEAKQAIRRWEMQTGKRLHYITAVPRMAEYERVSALIYSVLLRYAAPEDVHIYSIDESFIDATPYLHFYEDRLHGSGIKAARLQHSDVNAPHRQNSDMAAARLMAVTMIRDVLATTGITATVGIGTNLYLAKVAMDIVAKKSAPDRDGVRIAELDEDSYKIRLWEHRPLTDFWQIGPGKARTLRNACLFTMGDIAEMSLYDEEWFYKTFGIDGEILIDHAWGIEPVTMQDIKHYRPSCHSLSSGQVLPRPYAYADARIVFLEMIDTLCADMVRKELLSSCFTWWVGYDYKSLEQCPDYDGPLVMDFFGRIHPKHSNGTIRLKEKTNIPRVIADAMTAQFDRICDHRLLFRRLNVCANDVSADDGIYQLDFFTDHAALAREKQIQLAMLRIREKHGQNAVFTGKNLFEGATALERNLQIGGHKA